VQGDKEFLVGYGLSVWWLC